MTFKDKQLLIEYCEIIKQKLRVRANVILKFDFTPGSIGKHTWNPDTKSSTITLNTKYSVDVLIATLAHELTHSKQWQEGHMKYHGGFKRTYKNIYYEDLRKIPHSERPWEIEAYQVQHKVAKDLGLT